MVESSSWLSFAERVQSGAERLPAPWTLAPSVHWEPVSILLPSGREVDVQRPRVGRWRPTLATVEYVRPALYEHVLVLRHPAVTFEDPDANQSYTNGPFNVALVCGADSRVTPLGSLMQGGVYWPSGRRMPQVAYYPGPHVQYDLRPLGLGWVAFAVGPTSTTPRQDGGRIYHPHVNSNGTPCLGRSRDDDAWGPTLARLAGERDWKGVLFAIHEFLSVWTSDAYAHPGRIAGLPPCMACGAIAHPEGGGAYCYDHKGECPQCHTRRVTDGLCRRCQVAPAARVHTSGANFTLPATLFRSDLAFPTPIEWEDSVRWALTIPSGTYAGPDRRVHAYPEYALIFQNYRAVALCIDGQQVLYQSALAPEAEIFWEVWQYGNWSATLPSLLTLHGLNDALTRRGVAPSIYRLWEDLIRPAGHPYPHAPFYWGSSDPRLVSAGEAEARYRLDQQMQALADALRTEGSE